VASRLGAAPLGDWSEAAAQQWWKSRPPDVQWPQESETMKQSLREMQAAMGLEKAVVAPAFLGWLELGLWLSLAGDGKSTEAAQWLATPEGSKAFAGAGQDVPLRRLFLGSLSPFDDGPKAAQILCRIRQAHPAAVQKLPQAAVAFAIVWDQPFPAGWPHMWTRQNACALGDSDPVRRFEWFFSAYQKKRFLLDPSKLTVRDLIYVVDTPLELGELEYVLQVNLKDPRRLDELFQQVPYDMGRMQRGELQWPHGSYKLIEVGKKGGICADQAFFVEQTGKSQGIPTILLTGQGVTGGHAWVGYMGESARWTMDVARYKSERYVAGAAWEPQTWRRVTDAQLRFLFKEPATGPAVLRSRMLMLWAQINEDAAFQPRLLGLARAAWPRNLDIWEMQAACLERRSMSFEQKQAVLRQWIVRFNEDPDMRFQGQTRLLQLYESTGNAPLADALRKEIIAENRSGRFDLALKLAAAPAIEAAQAGKWDAAEKVFEKVMAQFRQKAGGELFYSLVQPVIDAMAQHGEMPRAKRLFSSVRNLFQTPEGSTLDVDIRQMEQLLQAPPGS
jgi:hypothetical protein